MKKNNIEELSILEIAELIRARAEEIKKEENMSYLKAFNRAYDELVRST